jgi:NADPH2 dehydrogenase
MNYPKMATFRTAEALRARFQELGITLGLDDTLEPGPQSPMGRPFDDGTIRVGNRWAILPMEGWDGTVDGHPTDLTRRRWHRFGLSGRS